MKEVEIQWKVCKDCMTTSHKSHMARLNKNYYLCQTCYESRQIEFPTFNNKELTT